METHPTDVKIIIIRLIKSTTIGKDNQINARKETHAHVGMLLVMWGYPHTGKGWIVSADQIGVLI